MQCMIGTLPDIDIDKNDLLDKLEAADPATKIYAQAVINGLTVDPALLTVIDEMQAAVERDIGD